MNREKATTAISVEDAQQQGRKALSSALARLLVADVWRTSSSATRQKDEPRPRLVEKR